MAYTQPHAVVTEEVFEEKDVVIPMRISQELLHTPNNGTLALLILVKYLG
jgi:hypothetical protein